MTNTMSEILFQIINKHLGDKLFVIVNEASFIRLKEGILAAFNNKKIELENPTHYEGRLSIPFKESANNMILNIYNTNFIDLLKAKKAQTLNIKLRNSEQQKRIITNLKHYLNKELYYVYKIDDKISVSLCKFIDMGLLDVTIRLSPFYNKDMKLKYDSILNIYDSSGEDLTE
jgi:hypothetical protein